MGLWEFVGAMGISHCDDTEDVRKLVEMPREAPHIAERALSAPAGGQRRQDALERMCLCPSIDCPMHRTEILCLSLFALSCRKPPNQSSRKRRQDAQGKEGHRPDPPISRSLSMKPLPMPRSGFVSAATSFEKAIFSSRRGCSSVLTFCCRRFAKYRGLKCMTKAAFIDDIFYGLGYDLRATILGFNLPFDLSRLAVRHNSARGKMRGGFSFQLSGDKWKARVQVKHVTARAALIQFAARRKHRDTKGDRKKKIHNPVRRGSLIDLKTVAAALLSRQDVADFRGFRDRPKSAQPHCKGTDRGYAKHR
jgi:hypothetical protein